MVTDASYLLAVILICVSGLVLARFAFVYVQRYYVKGGQR
jgi:hypothetical protein